MKIGFTCGAFDLFHAGHVLMLQDCKKRCDYLIVGIQTNPNIDRLNKSVPVQSIVERQIQVKGCRYVDETIVYETEKDLEEILKALPIDIRIVGIDHKNGFMTGKDICEDRGIEIYYNKRDHDYSTTRLRERIK